MKITQQDIEMLKTVRQAWSALTYWPADSVKHLTSGTDHLHQEYYQLRYFIERCEEDNLGQ